MTSILGPVVVSLSLAGSATAADQPPVQLVAGLPQRFQFFPAPPAVGTAAPIPTLDPSKGQSLVRLPGDADSVFTLGGPGPSGEPRVRLAVEVNEAALKVLAPDPKIEANDTRPRQAGDWKPIDAAGRPYQLRFGARIIW